MKDAFGHKILIGDEVVCCMAIRSSVYWSTGTIVDIGKTRVKVGDFDGDYSWRGPNRVAILKYLKTHEEIIDQAVNPMPEQVFNGD